MSGYFYRNRAQHQIYGYHHWFYGDSMVQKFHINNGKISHLGKIVDTAKRFLGKHKQKITMSTFSTHLSDKISSADQINPANISLMSFNKQLFAL